MGTLSDMENCVMCFDCVKKCPNDNVVLKRLTPFNVHCGVGI